MRDSVFTRSAEGQVIRRRLNKLRKYQDPSPVSVKADSVIRAVHPRVGKPKLSGVMAEIPFNERVGCLTIGDPEPVNPRRDRYGVTCSCGNWVALKPTEILGRIETGVGCGRLDCKTHDPAYQVMRCPDAAIELQIRLLIALNREDLQSYWGGETDDLYDYPVGIGISNFMTYVDGMVSWHKRNWFMQKKVEDLPFIEGNLIMGIGPHRFFKHLDKHLVPVDGGEMYLGELADLSGCSLDEMLVKVAMNPGEEINLEQIL